MAQKDTSKEISELTTRIDKLEKVLSTVLNHNRVLQQQVRALKHSVARVEHNISVLSRRGQ